MSGQWWLIGLSNTIHLLATVVWLAWSALLPLGIAPQVAEAHRDGAAGVARLYRRGAPLAYGALAVLGATGMLQMGAHPEYEGMFSLSNLWSGLLFVKHLFILGSVGLLLYVGQSLSPRLRLAVRRAGLGHPTNLPSLSQHFHLLTWLNLAAGVGVLLLTGFMTAIR